MITLRKLRVWMVISADKIKDSENSRCRGRYRVIKLRKLRMQRVISVDKIKEIEGADGDIR